MFFVVDQIIVILLLSKIMKRILSIAFVLSCLSCAVFAAEYRAVLVADIDSGRVLYQENANQK